MIQLGLFLFSYIFEIHMIQRELIAKTLPPDFVHVVTGTWATKAIHIDGALVTVNMLCELTVHWSPSICSVNVCVKKRRR